MGEVQSQVESSVNPELKLHLLSQLYSDTLLVAREKWENGESAKQEIITLQKIARAAEIIQKENNLKPPESFVTSFGEPAIGKKVSLKAFEHDALLFYDPTVPLGYRLIFNWKNVLDQELLKKIWNEPLDKGVKFRSNAHTLTGTMQWQNAGEDVLVVDEKTRIIPRKDMDNLPPILMANYSSKRSADSIEQHGMYAGHDATFEEVFAAKDSLAQIPRYGRDYGSDLLLFVAPPGKLTARGGDIGDGYMPVEQIDKENIPPEVVKVMEGEDGFEGRLLGGEVVRHLGPQYLVARFNMNSPENEQASKITHELVLSD